MRLPRAIAATFLTVLVVGSAAVYTTLPARIPVHFGFNNQPNAWATKSPVSWFMAPGIAVLTTLLLWGVVGLVRKRPDLMNLPNKRRFLAMSEEDREPVYQTMEDMLDWMAIFIGVVFGFVQLSSYQAAMRGSPGPFLMATLAMEPVIFIMIIGYVVRLNRLTGPEGQARSR